MSKISIANFKKALYYLKRNGLRDTYLAALERLQKNETDAYVYEAPTEKMLAEQWEKTEKLVEAFSQSSRPVFSILVPAYRTNADYLRAMINSVQVQSFGCFELIIADASEDDSVKCVVEEFRDSRIKYLHLKENKGISDNTNAALKEAAGDYIGLLDHDDVLTPDALFEMASAIAKAGEKGNYLQLLYSDEDKCDETGQYYYEPHHKKEFNLDLILSNNYICHFLVIEASLMKKLGFRREFDGAQDYDLTLRCIREILTDKQKGQYEPAVEKERFICHIPKVLYHWRCHRASTAENPQSKQYAYEAGKRAVADFIKELGIKGQTVATKHLGFYRICYEEDIFKARRDVGAVGGKLLNHRNKITGGIYTDTGECPYQGLYKDFSGYMHRAALRQDAYAVDIRLMKISPKLFPVAEEAAKGFFLQQSQNRENPLPDVQKETGEAPVVEQQPDGTLCLNGRKMSEEEYRALSISICQAIKAEGKRIVWEPDWSRRIS